MFSRLALIAALVSLAGCVQLSPRYLKGSAYEKAFILYEEGSILEARLKAEEVEKNAPTYKLARRLITEINDVSKQVARRHMELGEDYERAGIISMAISEYKTSLKFNPSNPLLARRITILLENAKEDERERKEPPRRTEPQRSPEKEDIEALANTHYLKGKVYLDAKSYQKAIEEFNAALKLVPAYADAKELLNRAKGERDREVDYHLKKGIGYFQREDMNLAIEEWDLVLELDPLNRKAAEYKERAETILDRLKDIKERQSVRPPM